MTPVQPRSGTPAFLRPEVPLPHSRGPRIRLEGQGRHLLGRTRTLPNPGLRFPSQFVPPTKILRQFWTSYFQKNEADSTSLWLILSSLRREQKLAEIEEVVRGFLSSHGEQAQPWMYELLAVAFELNKRPDAQIRSALGYAADLAVRGRQPHDLTRVADSLHLRGMDDRAGQLLDLAAEIDPSNPRPLLMSINLAGATKDPRRMGDTLSRLLALGWPGNDAQWRAEARKMAEDLATALNQENRQDQASNSSLSAQDRGEP